MHPYLGVDVALATKHQKEEQFTPAFSELGVKINVAPIDTDQLGTFSGEVARIGSAEDALRKKARLGMEHLSLPFGLASEGSIGSDPYIPFINSDIEMAIWIDDVRGFEIIERFRSLDIVAIREEVTRASDIDAILEKADFPRHGLIIKGSQDHLYKGITNRYDVDEALSQIWRVGDVAIIESDLRAHMSPSRRVNISEVASRLAKRLKELCPSCQTPGWGRVGTLRGVHCESCGRANDDAIRGEIEGCALCGEKQEKVLREVIDPGSCRFCNP